MKSSSKGVLLALGVIVVAGIILLPLFSRWTEAAPAGADLYKARCASCHAADGSGNSPVGKKMGLRDLGSAEVQAQSDAELKTITMEGKGKMPAYKGKLSDAEVDAIVKHMRTFK